MKKLLLVHLVFWGITQLSLAQFTAVNYDVEKNWFNEGQALPAEKSLVVKGLLPQSAQLVEFSILSAKKRDLLHLASAKRQANGEFALPISYKLRASDQYDFQVDFFQSLETQKQKQLLDRLKLTLSTYVEVNLMGKESIKLRKKASKIQREMNDLLAEELASYRILAANWPPELSEVVRLKLEQLDRTDLDQGYEKKDSTMTRQGLRLQTRNRLIDELKAQIGRELDNLQNTPLLVLTESYIVDNYPTEEKQNNISVNVGYGGVFINGNFDNFTYGAAPYVGLAFPLGNSVLGSRFLSNSSLTLGFFLDNFEDAKGNKISGLLVDRPIYLGLDHKLFRFIRVNAGAAFLEREILATLPDAVPQRDVLIRPYVGLSARIDLSIGFSK